MPTQIEQGFAQPQWDKASLAGQVAKLERQVDSLLDIAGSVLATIQINRARGTLEIDGEEAGKRFDSWVTTWQSRFDECSNEQVRRDSAAPGGNDGH